MKRTRQTLGQAPLLSALVALFTLCSCQGTLGDPPGGDDKNPASPPAIDPDTPEARTSGGRTPRRLSADQVRASLLEVTGYDYRGEAYVRDSMAPTGYVNDPNADLLDVYASSLGRPDYNYTVQESLEPGVTFAKMVGDAARFTCGQAAQHEVAGDAPGPPRLLVRVTAKDSLESNEAGVRENIAALGLRFWGRALDPKGEEVGALVEVFRVASTAEAWTDEGGAMRPKGGVADGWRAVCIAMATDPQFFIY
jgi:hypothetical protein